MPIAVKPMSLPSRERGLKLERRQRHPGQGLVAPFTGAWIEIKLTLDKHQYDMVAPFTGAWIEIRLAAIRAAPTGWSLPSRERGLKFSRV